MKKIIKDLLTKKIKFANKEIVKLSEEWNMIIRTKLSPKQPYSESFNIPCIIGKFSIPIKLCDFGESICLMPLFIMNKLGGKERSTNMALTLIDKSTIVPHEILEDVLVTFVTFLYLMIL